MNELSLDTETMGTAPGSAIVSIGAVFFDTSTGEMSEPYYRAINLATCVNEGLSIDASTVMWWMGQSDEARNAVRFSTYPLRHVLQEFSDWVLKQCSRGDVRVWARGPSFDCSLVAHAYRACKMDAPWFYWNERCHRTLTARNPGVVEPERVGTYHNAADDAIHQAMWLMKIAEHHRSKA